MSNRAQPNAPIRDREGRSRLRLVLSVAGAALAVGAVAYGAMNLSAVVGQREGGIRAVPERAPALPVRAIRAAGVEGYERERSFAGEVRARRSSQLAFERSARIAELAVSEGQRVAAGEVLASLDNRDIEARRGGAEARLDAARAQLAELEAGPRAEQIDAARARVDELVQRLELARIVETRRQKLIETQAIATEELDAARIDAAALEASVASARAQLEELEQGTRTEQLAAQRARVAELEANLVAIEVELDRSRLVAPFDAVIESVHAEAGSVPAPASPVLSLVEAVDTEAWIGLPPDRAAALDPGSSHTVRIGARELDARFLTTLPSVDRATRTRTAIFRLSDVDISVAVPGEIAELVAAETVDARGIWLSAEGLVQSRRGLWAAYVLVELEADTSGVEGATHRLIRRELETIATDGARVLVRGDLAEGELVLADGAQRVTAGQPVRLIDEVEAAR